jgi:hypothetical protein
MCIDGIHTHTYICVCVCVYIHMCMCVNCYMLYTFCPHHNLHLIYMRCKSWCGRNVYNIHDFNKPSCAVFYQVSLMQCIKCVLLELIHI